ncbi:hypothetical protein BK142_26820 [Paenibacillus glucanolyticus]|nr:hypothetical protein BK142_26820 [Paenibacillus glucanolyticus]
MKIDRIAKLISSGVFIVVLFFVFFGPTDSDKLSNIFEKIATLNITISIGYGALLAAVAALSSHNTRQDNDIKTELVSFVYVTISYILLNIIIFVGSFMINVNFITFPGRIMIGILITILIIYTNYLYKLCIKLIY